MKILHLVSSLDYTGAAAQLGLLAKHLRPGPSLRICCFGREGPWAPCLRNRGLRVDCLRWTRAFDPTPLWKLRRLLSNEPPDVIHVWGVSTLRVLALVGPRWLSRTLVSQPFPRELKNVSPLSRWLLRRVQTVVAPSQVEAQLCRQLGVNDRNLTIVPPAVEIPLMRSPAPTAKRTAGPRIVCVGALEPRKGFRDAVWALDMLRHAFPASRLALVGDGPQRAYLEWFAGLLEAGPVVELLGQVDDAAALISQADVCWAPTLAGSSRQVVLEAMAAGRPVIAADRPALREVITEGHTGYLVPAGDKVGVCKRTRSLHLDPDLACQVGEAGRQYVAQHHAPDSWARRWLEHYNAAASASVAA